MKAYKRLLVFFLLATLARQLYAAEVEWHGFAQTIHGAGVSGQGEQEGQWLIQQEKLQLDISAEAGPVRLSAKPEIIHDDEENAIEWDLREFQLSGRAGDLDWRAGRLIFTWGITDFWPVLDIINPYDYSIFRNFQPEDQKVAVTALDLTYYLGDWEIELIGLPAHESFKLAESPDDPWLFYGPRQMAETGIPLAVEKPASDLSNAEGALRVRRPIGDWSLAGYYFYGRDRMGFPTMQFDPTNGMPIGAVMAFHRQQVFGLSAQGSVGPDLIRLETAYYKTPDKEGDDPSVRNDMAKATIGWERYLFLDINAHLQYIVEWRVQQDEYEAALGPNGSPEEEFDHKLTLKLQASWLNDQLQPYVFAFYRPQDDEFMVNPQIAWLPSDGLEIALGGIWFESTRKDTLVGQFDANDYVYGRFTYFF